MPSAASTRRRIFSAWLSTAPVVLMANPWGQFGWVELTASIGPCVLGIDRRIRPLATAAVGFLAICLLTLQDGGDGAALRLAGAASVFLIGVVLAARALVEPELGARDTDGAEADERAAQGFRMRLEREFGRARRHGRGLALLSITAKPRRAASAAAGATPETEADPSRRTARALETVRALLARELRVYSDVVVEEGRVLALVPEIESESFEAFVARVCRVLEQGTELVVAIGAASFPKDAVCVEALVEAADRDRRAAKTADARPPIQAVMREGSA